KKLLKNGMAGKKPASINIGSIIRIKSFIFQKLVYNPWARRKLICKTVTYQWRNIDKGNRTKLHPEASSHIHVIPKIFFTASTFRIAFSVFIFLSKCPMDKTKAQTHEYYKRFFQVHFIGCIK